MEREGTPPQGVDSYVFTGHASDEMARRSIDPAIVRAVLAEPEQSEPVRPGRMVLQSRLSFAGDATIYLVRVFVDVDREPAEVVTVYRTSKIGKYWTGAP